MSVEKQRLVAEIAAEIAAAVAAEVLAEAAADVAGRTELLVELAGGTELGARVEIRQPEELEVLLVAVRCWDSLESQTSLQRVVGA